APGALPAGPGAARCDERADGARTQRAGDGPLAVPGDGHDLLAPPDGNRARAGGGTLSVGRAIRPHAGARGACRQCPVSRGTLRPLWTLDKEGETHPRLVRSFPALTARNTLHRSMKRDNVCER